MFCSLVRSLSAALLLFSNPLLAARLKAGLVRKPDSKCCCMAGPCMLKGNAEDKFKVGTSIGQEQYCCKARSYRFSEARCDKKAKYTLPYESLKKQGFAAVAELRAEYAVLGSYAVFDKFLNVASCEVISHPTSQPTAVPWMLFEPTAVPTPEPTPEHHTLEPTVDPDSFVDVTSTFGEKKVIQVDSANYMCCCQSAGSHHYLRELLARITCELVDITSPPVYMTKSGCGGLKGDGFHSWNRMPTLPKYQEFENVGKCVVSPEEAEFLKKNV